MGCTSTKVGVEENLLEKVWNEFCLASFRTKRIENIHDIVLDDENLFFVGHFKKSDINFTDAGILNSNLEKKCTLAIVCDNVDIPTYFDAYIIIKNDPITPQYFQGTVIHGKAKGRLIGYRTANLDTTNHGLDIGTVYSCEALVNNKKYLAVLCVNWENIVEVHILDFDEDIYGKTIKIFITSFIRKMEPITDLSVLKKAIANDIKMALEF